MADFSEGWSSSSDQVQAFPVLRVPNNEVPVDVVVHSRDHLCVGQHFFGRPFVCPGRDCPACDRGHGARVVCYLLVQMRRDGKHKDFLFEANRDSFGSFLDPCRGSYTGYQLQISRRRRKLVLQWSGEPATAVSNLQTMRPLLNAVAILYKLRTTADLDRGLDDAQLLVQWRGLVVPSLQECLRRALKD